MRAQIRFLPRSEGGRNRFPTWGSGDTYSTVAVFVDEQNAQIGAWSLVVEFLGSVNRDGTALVNVRFLAENTPQALLCPGSQFGLLEEDRVVATGQIEKG